MGENFLKYSKFKTFFYIIALGRQQKGLIGSLCMSVVSIMESFLLAEVGEVKLAHGKRISIRLKLAS